MSVILSMIFFKDETLYQMVCILLGISRKLSYINVKEVPKSIQFWIASPYLVIAPPTAI